MKMLALLLLILAVSAACFFYFSGGRVASTPAPPPPVPAAPPPARASNALVAEAWRETLEATKECKQDRLSGRLKTHLDSAECSNPHIVAAFRRANFPDMDLVQAMTAKRIELAQKVDSGEMTEADTERELQAFLRTMADTERQRDSGR